MGSGGSEAGGRDSVVGGRWSYVGDMCSVRAGA